MPKNSVAANAPLGRPRGFDADAALAIALDVFWQQGYEATTLDSLCHAMGLSRSSFYACFGSKHALLMAAVQRYADERYEAMTQRVAACADPRQAVRDMLAVIADVEGGTRGCLFVNAVAELAPGDAELVAFAQAHTARVGALMTATLRRLGCAAREAPARAGALLALVMGVATLRKTGVPASQLTGFLTQADHLLAIVPPTEEKAFMSPSPQATPVVFIPALLCDERLYGEVVAALGEGIEPHVLLAPLPRLEDSVADILARAPERFALVGTSYGGNLALEVALAAPERVTALWLMGCDPGAPQAGGPDLAGGLEATPAAVFDMLAALVVHEGAAAQAAIFKSMAERVGGPAGAAQARALGGRREAASRLGALTMPALVLWGEQDALVPVAVGRALAAALPKATFEVLPGCGHLPTLEKPAESAAMFAELLKTAGARFPTSPP